jgi:hypothetical protein
MSRPDQDATVEATPPPPEPEPASKGELAPKSAWVWHALSATQPQLNVASTTNNIRRARRAGWPQRLKPQKQMGRPQRLKPHSR